MGNGKRWNYQFRLVELFAAVTVFAIAFAIVRSFGFAGLLGAAQIGLYVAGACILVMECHDAIKQHLGW